MMAQRIATRWRSSIFMRCSKIVVVGPQLLNICWFIVITKLSICSSILQSEASSLQMFIFFENNLKIFGGVSFCLVVSLKFFLGLVGVDLSLSFCLYYNFIVPVSLGSIETQLQYLGKQALYLTAIWCMNLMFKNGHWSGCTTQVFRSGSR